MGKVKSRTSIFDEPASYGIDAQNYVARALAFLAAKPGRAGFVIRGVDGINGSELSREPATDAQWLAWLAYFDAKRIGTTAMVHFGCTTVPAEWPEDFDADAPLSDRQAIIPRRPRPRFDFGRRALGMTDELARKLARIGCERNSQNNS